MNEKKYIATSVTRSPHGYLVHTTHTTTITGPMPTQEENANTIEVISTLVESMKSQPMDYDGFHTILQSIVSAM
jgi:hypothetical protein